MSMIIIIVISYDDVPLVVFMYLVFTRMPCESYVSNSGLCCCICVTYFERGLTPLCVDCPLCRPAHVTGRDTRITQHLSKLSLLFEPWCIQRWPIVLCRQVTYISDTPTASLWARTVILPRFTTATPVLAAVMPDTDRNSKILGVTEWECNVM